MTVVLFRLGFIWCHPKIAICFVYGRMQVNIESIYAESNSGHLPGLMGV